MDDEICIQCRRLRVSTGVACVTLLSVGEVEVRSIAGSRKGGRKECGKPVG